MTTIDPRDLRRVWAREAPHRPHWPEGFDACCADPLVLRIMETMVRHSVPAYARRGVKSGAPRWDQWHAAHATFSGRYAGDWATAWTPDAPARPEIGAGAGVKPPALPQTPPEPVGRLPGPFRVSRPLAPGETDCKRAASGDRDD